MRSLDSPTLCSTAVTCIDGRFHQPVLRFMRRSLRTPTVDLITSPGVVRLLHDGVDPAAISGVLEAVRISIHLHESRTIAVVGHDDCGANKVPPDVHLGHVRSAVEVVKRRFPETNVVGLFVDLRGRVEPVGPPSHP